MHGSRRQSLLDAVAVRLVLQRRHRNRVNAFRQRIASPRHVIPAPRDPHRNTHQCKSNPPPHGTSFSASFTAFQAGSRILSAAPQNQKVPGADESSSGGDNAMDFSPATLTLLGRGSPSGTTANPASLQTSSMLLLERTSTCAHAIKVAPWKTG